MLRITLLEPYDGVIGHRFGYENVIPMDHGAFAPELATKFRGSRVKSGAQPCVWPMQWDDESMRSVLVPNEVAQHYYGDHRAGTDATAEDKGLIPSFNNERERVANVWGGFYVSPLHAFPAVVRIAVPKMPKVRIEAVNAGGASVGSWFYEPTSFWRFEELLADNAAEELLQLQARRSKKPIGLSLEGLTDADLDKLSALLDKRKKLASAGTK